MKHDLTVENLQAEMLQLHRHVTNMGTQILDAIRQSGKTTQLTDEIRNEKMLTSKEVQGMLNISSFKLSCMRDKKEIPFVQFGKSMRYPYSKVKEMLDYMKSLSSPE